MAIERLIEKIRNNEVILWTGAGFSLYAGMPTVGRIKEAILESCTEEEKEELQGYSNLSEMSQEFVEMRNGSRHELNRILSGLIDIEPKCHKFHSMLSEIPQIDTIVSTNYDLLFEEAYGRNLIPIIENLHLPYADEKKVKLYKIHGDIRHPNSMIITTGDYTQFFRETDTPIWNKIKSLLAEKTILFVGYSLQDQNIDYLVDNVITALGANVKESFLVAPGLAKRKISRLQQKKIEYIDMTGEELVKEIHSEIKKKL